jgi:Flp pilus assembly protein TadG
MNGHDRGSISVVMSIMLVMVLSGAGLVVDGGRAMAARRHASNIAEAAARAAVSTATPVSGFDPATARSAAIDYATRAGVDPVDVVVEVRPDAVRVTVTERRRTVFLVLGGRSTMTVRATGVARVVYSSGAKTG